MVKDYPSQKNPVMILVISDLLFLIVEKNVKKKGSGDRFIKIFSSFPNLGL